MEISTLALGTWNSNRSYSLAYGKSPSTLIAMYTMMMGQQQIFKKIGVKEMQRGQQKERKKEKNNLILRFPGFSCSWSCILILFW